MAAEDARVTLIAMIEDPEAIDNIDEIVAVEGLDGVFIGRGDLAAAYSQSGDAAARVAAATQAVHAAALSAAGSTAFILSSDQGFLRSAAMQAHSRMSEAVTQAARQSGKG